jgi:hypothetical protein
MVAFLLLLLEKDADGRAVVMCVCSRCMVCMACHWSIEHLYAERCETVQVTNAANLWFARVFIANPWLAAAGALL